MDRWRISIKYFFSPDFPVLVILLSKRQSYKIIYTMLSTLTSKTKGQPKKEDRCESAEKKAELD